MPYIDATSSAIFALCGQWTQTIVETHNLEATMRWKALNQPKFQVCTVVSSNYLGLDATVRYSASKGNDSLR